MKRRQRRSLPTDPFTAWGTLALRTTEMLAASARVINHRTTRRNNPAQLFEMGNEKLQAAIESSHAMTRAWLAMGNPASLGASWNQWATLFTRGLTPFHRRALRNARRATRR
jgi:hypothetical protein